MSSIHQSEQVERPVLLASCGALVTDARSAILDATGCLIVAIELGSGHVVAVNATAENVSGVPREEWLGRPVWELVDPAHAAGLRSGFTSAQGAGIPRVYEATMGTRSGDPRDGQRVLWSSEFVSDAAGVRSHVVLTGIVVSGGNATASLVNHMMRAATEAVMIGTDRRGRVTFCSAGAERLLGFAAEELMGRAFPQSIFEPVQFEARAAALGVPADLTLLTESFSRADRREHQAPRLGSLDRRGTRKTNRRGESGSLKAGLQGRDWTLIRKDGVQITVSVSVSRVTDAAGRHIGFVGVAHDVTEQRLTHQLLVRALEQETQAVERLRALDQQKSDFVATVSHELRTPVTSIAGYTELLEDGLAGPLTVEQLKAVGAVRRNAQRLAALADDLLTLASSQEGTLGAESIELDLRTVISGAQELLKPLLLSRRLDMVFELPDGPAVVIGDAKQLERAVLNLLNNAIKFTEDDGRISCRLSSRADEVLIAVEDTGIGIPKEEQDNLFASFFRASSAQDRAIQGTGLGLSIAAAIVENHGGDITLESEHLRGSTFTVRLPKAPGTRIDELHEG